MACIGENSYTETPGNLTDLTLSENQRNLVKALAKTGKPIVLVLNEGRPRIIADIEPLAQAVIHIMLPGNYGGDALAGLVSGRYNFSGRLPFTYPSEINSLTNYDFKKSKETGTMEGAYDYNARITQQWGFGHGLSYTTFEYSNLQVSVLGGSAAKSRFTKDDVLTVTFQLPAADLAFVGYDGRWTLEEGDFLLSVGTQTQTITCTETYTWDSPNR